MAGCAHFYQPALLCILWHGRASQLWTASQEAASSVANGLLALGAYPGTPPTLTTQSSLFLHKTSVPCWDKTCQSNVYPYTLPAGVRRWGWILTKEQINRCFLYPPDLSLLICPMTT